MIIILDGPDGSGKTTLAKKIAQQTGYEYAHMSYPVDSEESAGMYNAYAQKLQHTKNLVFDRAWYSEMVYGPIKRGISVISYYDMYALEALVAKSGGLIIHCTAPKKALLKRCATRGETFVSPAQIVETCDAFEKLMAIPHNIPVVRYEYKDV